MQNPGIQPKQQFLKAPPPHQRSEAKPRRAHGPQARTAGCTCIQGHWVHRLSWLLGRPPVRSAANLHREEYRKPCEPLRQTQFIIFSSLPARQTSHTSSIPSLSLPRTHQVPPQDVVKPQQHTGCGWQLLARLPGARAQDAASSPGKAPSRALGDTNMRGVTPTLTHGGTSAQGASAPDSWHRTPDQAPVSPETTLRDRAPQFPFLLHRNRPKPEGSPLADEKRKGESCFLRSLDVKKKPMLYVS